MYKSRSSFILGVERFALSILIPLGQEGLFGRWPWRKLRVVQSFFFPHVQLVVIRCIWLINHRIHVLFIQPEIHSLFGGIFCDQPTWTLHFLSEDPPSHSRSLITRIAS